MNIERYVTLTTTPASGESYIQPPTMVPGEAAELLGTHVVGVGQLMTVWAIRAAGQLGQVPTTIHTLPGVAASAGLVAGGNIGQTMAPAPQTDLEVATLNRQLGEKNEEIERLRRQLDGLPSEFAVVTAESEAALDELAEEFKAAGDDEAPGESAEAS